MPFHYSRHGPECGRSAALGKAAGSVWLLDERIRIGKDTDGVGTRLRISIGCIERQDGLAHGLIIALEPHPDIREYMPGLASARPPAPLVEILDLIDAFAPEALISVRSEEHTSELQSLMRISYAVFYLKKQKQIIH